MTEGAFRAVLLVVGPVSEGGVDGARIRSLWRGLCQCSETWRIDIGVENGPGAGNPRRRACAAADLPGAVAALLEQSGAQTIVVAAGGGLDLGTLPNGLRLIGVPDQRGALVDGAGEIWTRTGPAAGQVAAAGRPVHRISDAFDAPAGGGDAPPRDVVAVVGAAADLPETLPGMVADAAELVVPQALAGAVNGLVDAPLRPVRSTAEALEQAGAVILAGPGEDLAALRSWAALNGRAVLWPDAAAGADAVGLDPARTLRDLRAALGQKRAPDAATIGRLVQRNLGLDFTLSAATFHAPVRLYHVLIDVGGSGPPDCLTARIMLRSGDDGGLVNAWVQSIAPMAGFSGRLRATAALDPAVAPEDVTIDIDAWGWPVARFDTPPALEQETSGLIGMALDDAARTATVRYWSLQPDTVIQFGKKSIQVRPEARQKGGPCLFEADSAFPFNRPSLTTIPKSGRGQKFTQFHLFDAAHHPSSARLQKMRGAFAGRSAWIIGNGPSVRLDDLDRLAEAGSLCFGFNRFHLAHESTRLRPRFTVTGDRQMIEDFGQDIVDRSGGTVFVADQRPPDLLGDYIWLRQISVFPSLFSSDAAHLVTPGGSSVYVAMQIGHYLGIRRWYMYGADFGFHFSPPRTGASAFRSAEGDGNHFIANYRSGRPWCPPAIENILPSFYAARLMMEMEGGFIRNATRGGHLNVFDRIDFDAALRQDRAAMAAAAARPGGRA